jgi:pyruvate carboxylase subunit B
MKYKFQVESNQYEVEIPSSVTFHTESEVRLGKDSYRVSVAENRNGIVHAMMLNNKFYQVEILKDDDGYPKGIYVDGEYFSANLLKIDKLFYYKEKSVPSSKSGMVKSFIPGNIKKVFFREGEAVDEGDLILIHEAMKMENEMRAPKRGTIKRLGVEEGDNILANHLLFEIE